MKTLSTVLLLVGLVGIASCGQPARPPAAADGGAAQPRGEASPPRTLTMGVHFEAAALAPKATTAQGVNGTLRLFSAQLTYVDGAGAIQPYLAEAVPQLNTDTWRVLPDGTMDVVYKLRAGLAWHDGQPLTADDFVFSYRAFTTPGVGVFTATPQNLMADVEARDPQTFVIHWKSLYPEAANLRLTEFDPVPRHVLEGPLSRYQQDPTGQMDAFRNLPYWTQEYVGAGPFRLERWDPGSQLEGVAFAAHALGRPKIDRVIVKIIGDENTALSSILSEGIDVATDFTLRYEHAVVLLNNWDASKRGLVLLGRGPMNFTMTQFRPDYQKTPALLDVRVRRAMAHALDRQTLNEALFDGRGFMTDTNMPDDVRFYPQLERSIAHYPYDPQRAEQLMAEAGFAKDASGLFATAPSTSPPGGRGMAEGGERFRPEFWVISGPLYEKQQLIMHDTWARAGIDTEPRVMNAAQLRDFEASVTFSGLSSRLLQPNETQMLNMYTTPQIGSPLNRWLGNNRSAWVSPDYDRLFDSYSATLDRAERDRLIIDMMKLTADQLPVLPTYFNIEVLAHLASVRGPAVGSVERLNIWNVHEWEML